MNRVALGFRPALQFLRRLAKVFQNLRLKRSNLPQGLRYTSPGMLCKIKREFSSLSRSLLKNPADKIPLECLERLYGMRGNDNQQQPGMFSYVSLEERVPAKHPLRAIREIADEVLAGMSAEFDGLYAETGRPSIPPERLFRALLLQVFYTIRSERMLMEQLDYNLLFRWFTGLEIEDEVWNHAVFSKNRDRLLNQKVAQSFFAQVKGQAAGLMSDEHFTVDGTLIEAWASHKSFQKKDDGESGPGSRARFSRRETEQ